MVLHLFFKLKQFHFHIEYLKGFLVSESKWHFLCNQNGIKFSFPATISFLGCRLGRLQDSNAVLSHFNEYSENCFSEVSADFSRNTRILKSMKSDLDYVFQKLRYISAFVFSFVIFILIVESEYSIFKCASDCLAALSTVVAFQWLLICIILPQVYFDRQWVKEPIFFTCLVVMFYSIFLFWFMFRSVHFSSLGLIKLSWVKKGIVSYYKKTVKWESYVYSELLPVKLTECNLFSNFKSRFCIMHLHWIEL